MRTEPIAPEARAAVERLHLGPEPRRIDLDELRDQIDPGGWHEGNQESLAPLTGADPAVEAAIAQRVIGLALLDIAESLRGPAPMYETTVEVRTDLDVGVNAFVLERARGLLDGSDRDTNPEYVRALAELVIDCSAGLTSDDKPKVIDLLWRRA